MEKELTITPPEGYEIDKDRSSFERIVFKKKDLEYKDVTKKLFKIENDCAWFVTPYSHGDFFTSAEQSKKLVAINRLMNVAKYLNGDWKPNWEDPSEDKYTIGVNSESDEISVFSYWQECSSIIYFKSVDIAKQAVKILGEDTIRLALSTDW